MKAVAFQLVFAFLIFIRDGSLAADCSPKADIPCKLYKFKNDGCFSENLKREFPFYETNTTRFPGTPGSFDPKSLRYKLHTEYNIWYPGVNLSFTTPQNGAFKFVKGFEIVRYDITNKPSCYILDLSNVTWDENSLEQMNTQFQLELWPLNNADPIAFKFEAYALPKQRDRDDKYDQYLNLYIKFAKYLSDESNTARNWRATIYFYQDSKLGTISVKIVPPPEEFGFREYEYSLYNTVSGQFLNSANSQAMSHNFTSVPTGTYEVWVKPMSGTDDKKCPCGVIAGDVCEHCLTTKSETFNFTYTGLPFPVAPSPTTSTVVDFHPSSSWTNPKEDGAISTLSNPKEEVSKDMLTSTTKSKDVTEIKVAMAVLGAFFGLALALVVAGFIYYRRCRKVDEKVKTMPGEPGNGELEKACKNPAFADDISYLTIQNIGNFNNDKAEKVRFEKCPKLFLLYEDDHDYHRNVVNNFATYLQQHCQCVVMCVEWQLDAPWVHQDLQQADYIVIVNSEGAYTTYMNKFGQQNESVTSHQHSSPMTKRMSSINSVRNKFLHDERYDNIVMVYFEYTNEKYILPDICPGYKYQLMKHFTDFLLHIHKLHRTDNLMKYDLPLDGDHGKRPIGQKLLESIAAAECYQQQNPKWAQNRFGYDRMWSHVSEDSKFDSGLPEDFNSPVQTPEIEGQAPFKNQDVFIHLLEGKSVCTVNPSDIGFAPKQEPNILPSFTEEVNVSHAPKHRPKLSPQNFTAEAKQVQGEGTPPPPSCSTVESDFGFFPPDDFDDEFDVLSKTQSEQMKSIVDRYQARNNFETSQYNNMQVYRNHYENYDKNRDLLLLKVHSGEVPFIECNTNGEVISLGGESV